MAPKKKAGRPPKRASHEIEHDNRARILDVAIQVFSEKGYDGATIQEIVRKADTNLSMISYYFGGKENLYKACLSKAADLGVASAQKLISATPKNREEFLVRLRMFIEEIMDFHLNNRDLTRLIEREVINTDGSLLPKDNFLKIYSDFESFFHTAKKSGFLCSKLDVVACASFVFEGVISLSKTTPCVCAVLPQNTIANKKFKAAMLDFLTGSLLSGILAPTK